MRIWVDIAGTDVSAGPGVLRFFGLKMLTSNVYKILRIIFHKKYICI